MNSSAIREEEFRVCQVVHPRFPKAFLLNLHALKLHVTFARSWSVEWSGVRTIVSGDLQEKVGKKNENRKGKRLTELKNYRKVQKQKVSKSLNH